MKNARLSRRVIESPWKALNHLHRWMAYPRVRLLFALNRIEWGQGWGVFGVPIIQKHSQSAMNFGPGLQLRSSIRSNPLSPTHPVVLSTLKAESRLQVGSNFSMTGGTLCAGEKITIGDNVVVGANCIIVDTDFHPLLVEERGLRPSDGKVLPVVIESDVFIGMNCIVLKGVNIGKGSVIGAGSVVTSRIPAYVVAAGNPARRLRDLPHNSEGEGRTLAETLSGMIPGEQNPGRRPFKRVFQERDGE